VAISGRSAVESSGAWLAETRLTETKHYYQIPSFACRLLADYTRLDWAALSRTLPITAR
jgi:hypothetical protein